MTEFADHRRWQRSAVPVGTVRTFGPRPRGNRIWTSRESFLTDLAVFGLGASGVYSVGLVGSLPGSEILILPLLPVLLVYRGGRALNRQHLWFLILVAAWLVGTVVADTYNEGSWAVNRMKGIARVVFFAFDFIALAILLNRKTRRMIVFALSMIPVFVSAGREFRGDFLTEWKFGYSSALTIVALIAASYYNAKQKYKTCIFIFLLLSALNLYFAFRSQLVIILIAGALTLPIFEDQRVSARSHTQTVSTSSNFRPFVLLALAGGAILIANQAIKFAATQGFLGENISSKFQTQSSGKLGVLFGGRPETLVAIQAIIDSPIIGHGSFAGDPKYLELKQDLQYEYGYSDSDTPDEQGAIPTHSHLTMAWVESGIFGGLLWLYILVLTLRAILQTAIHRQPLSPLYCYFLVNFVWDILFSPFGSVNRLQGAYFVLLSYNLLKTSAKPIPNTERSRAPHLTRTIVRRRLAQ
jgi:O-antigen ligase